jgi:hypothetical protein
MDDGQRGVVMLAALMVTLSECFAYHQEDLFKGGEYVIKKKYNFDNVTPLNRKVITKAVEKDLLDFKNELWDLRKRLFKIESALIKSVDADTVDHYIETIYNALDTLKLPNENTTQS